MAKGIVTPNGSSVVSVNGSTEEEGKLDSANDAKEQKEGCEVLGCMAHVTRKFYITEVDKTKTNYEIRIHFKSINELLVNAAPRVVQKAQQSIAAGGKFPSGRLVEVDCEAKYSKTADDLAEDYLNMSETEREATRKALEAQIQALQKAMSVAGKKGH